MVDRYLADGDPHVRQSCAGLVPGSREESDQGAARQSLGPPCRAELTRKPGSDQRKPRDTEKGRARGEP